MLSTPNATTDRGRQLYRDPAGPIAGVATGIARYFGVDPLLVQVLFVLFGFFGVGIAIYIALWLVLPTVGPAGQLVRPAEWQVVFGAVILGLVAFSGTLLIGIPGAGGIAIILIVIGVLLLSQRPPTPAAPGVPPGRTFGPPTAGTPPFVGTVPGYGPAPGYVQPYVNPGQQPGQQPTRQNVAGQHPADHYPPMRYQQMPTPVAGYAWAQPRVEPAPRPPAEPTTPRPPITALTLAIAVFAAAVVAALSSVLPLSSAATWGMFALVCGGGLVASAFTGRGAWLLLIPASFALIGMGAAISAERWSLSMPDWSVGEVNIRVSDPADLSDSYSIGVGELWLDVSEMTLTRDVSINLSVGAGEANIVVPDDMNVVLIGDVGQGEINWFGETIDSVQGNFERTHRGGGETAPRLTINADVGIGELNVNNG